MNRREFIGVCSGGCIGGIAIASLLTACKTSKTISGQIEDSDIVIDATEFEIYKKGELSYRKYLLIENEKLNFPIGVFRFNENEYSALYLQCTHQGVELQVLGDRLHCPAHGSEFSNKGTVQQGPAESNLRSFLIKIESNKLKISLK